MKDEILNILYEAVDEINDTLPKRSKLGKSPDTWLFGGLSQLKSIDVVRFIIAAEEKLQDKFDRKITLADKRAFSAENSPFRTIGTLVDHIAELLKNE